MCYEGTLPVAYGALSSLQEFHLQNNSLEGKPNYSAAALCTSLCLFLGSLR